MILPEVKDPAKWFGGHLWADNQSGKNLLYSFVAQMTPSIYYNTNLVKPQDVRSYNDLLDAKWKGKIGLRDPRVPGGGLAMWAFLLDTKGEEYVRKLAQQEMFVSRNARQIADALAKGSLAMTIGVGYPRFRRVSRRQPAGQTSADVKGRHLCQRRQRHPRHRQRRAAPQRGQSIFQLAAQPRRARAAQSNRATAVAPAGCRCQRSGWAGGQGCVDGGRVSPRAEFHRR